MWNIDQLKECDKRFHATVDAVAASSKAQAEAIAAHAISSELRHKELIDQLSVVIAISESGKKSVSLVGWLGEKLSQFGDWLKRSITGIAAIIFLYMIITGRVKWADFIALLTK